MAMRQEDLGDADVLGFRVRRFGEGLEVRVLIANHSRVDEHETG